MASSSGTSSGSMSTLKSSSSEEDLQQIMEERKQKRKLSNRESARRSRMRKQKLLDELMEQIAQLKKQNNQILTSMNLTTQLYLNMEAENSVLRAQMSELNNRLQSLSEIESFLNASNGVFDGFGGECVQQICDDSSFMINPWSSSSFPMNQPIMASADMIMY